MNLVRLQFTKPIYKKLIAYMLTTINKTVKNTIYVALINLIKEVWVSTLKI